MQNSNQNTAGLSSKILKYLAELLVVVFGVYLGFKANNYASELTQKDYVNATIKEMYHSLEQDIKDAELNMEGHRKGIVIIYENGTIEYTAEVFFDGNSSIYLIDKDGDIICKLF